MCNAERRSLRLFFPSTCVVPGFGCFLGHVRSTAVPANVWSLRMGGPSHTKFPQIGCSLGTATSAGAGHSGDSPVAARCRIGRRVWHRGGRVGVIAAAVLLLSSLMGASSQYQNPICLTGNCSSPVHICGVVPATSWLSEYIPSTIKICYCANYTFAGRSCNIPCPGGHGNPCSGHGECLFNSAKCACDFGWQGSSCSAKCPTTYGSVCASKGTCVEDGLDGAKCECFPGFRGGNCTVECVGDTCICKRVLQEIRHMHIGIQE